MGSRGHGHDNGDQSMDTTEGDADVDAAADEQTADLGAFQDLLGRMAGAGADGSIQEDGLQHEDNEGKA